MDRGKVRQLEDARAGPRTVPFAELDASSAERSPGARVLENVHRAVGGRRELQRVDRLDRPVHVELRLVAVPFLARELRFRRGACRQDLRFDFLQPLFGVRQAQFRRFVLDARDEVALPEIELRALDVVLRPGQLRLPLLGGDLLLRDNLLDFTFGGLQLHQALFELRRVELDDDVSLVHRGAVLDQLDDLQLAASLERRRENDRLRRPDIAANLDVIHEVAARDVGGRDVRHGVGPRVHRDAGCRDDEDDGDAAEERLAAKDLHFAAAALRATVTPSWSPPVTIASCVFIAPIVTSCRSSLPPSCTRTYAFSPSSRIASRGTTSADGTRSSSTSSDAVRSGIRFGCAPFTRISTMKLRTFGDSVDCCPIGEIWSILPEKTSSG